MERVRYFTAKLALLLGTAPDRPAAVRLAILTLLLWTKKTLGRRGGRLYRVRVAHSGRTAEMLVCEYTDLEVIREVWGGDAYVPPAGFAPRTIVDLGSNFGASVKLFRAQFPDAEIHAVEPDPVSLRTLTANVADDPLTTVHPVAVAGETGRTGFFRSQHGWASSLAGDHNAHGGEWVDVDAVTLGDLLARTGHPRVDLLKMDIEGGEWNVFASTRLSDVAELVLGELHGQDDRPAADFSPGLDGLTVTYTDPPHNSTFVAAR